MLGHVIQAVIAACQTTCVMLSSAPYPTMEACNTSLSTAMNRVEPVTYESFKAVVGSCLVFAKPYKFADEPDRDAKVLARLFRREPPDEHSHRPPSERGATE